MRKLFCLVALGLISFVGCAAETAPVKPADTAAPADTATPPAAAPADAAAPAADPAAPPAEAPK